MPGGHALRGMASAGLALIVLETFARTSNGNVGGLFASFGTIAQRLMSPSVPLIPDRRVAGAGGSGAPSYFGATPAAAAAGAAVAGNLPAVGAITGPGSLTGNPSLGQYAAGGGLAGIGANPALQPGAPTITVPRAVPYGRAPR